MGTHLKKCEICGRMFEESDDLNVLLLNGPAQCPYCKEIIELRNLLQNYDHDHSKATWHNEIFEKNMIPDGPARKDGFGFSSQNYTLDEHTTEFEIKNRTKTINDLIERIDYIRRLLVGRIGAQFKILDSIYEDKDIFWEEGGNFRYYVNDASMQYVVIKLKDLISNKNSRYSIPKIRNIIENHKSEIYSVQEITEVYRFKHSGDVMRQKYEPFPIVDYLAKLDRVFDDYKEILNAISDVRDNEYAHIDKVKNEDSFKKINYCGLKRIFNSSKIIYDGFLFSIAPDKFTNLFNAYSDIWFSQLNREVNYWIEEMREPRKANKKQRS